MSIINNIRSQRKKRPRSMSDFPIAADVHGGGSRLNALDEAFDIEMEQSFEWVREKTDEYDRAFEAGPWC